MRMLTQLRIDEVSAVLKGASEGARVLIQKVDKPANFYAPRSYLTFNEAMEKQLLEKLSEAEAAEDVRDEDDYKKLSNKLRAMVEAMIVAEPTLTKEAATHHLLHTARGRDLAEHLNNLSKKDTPPMLDISKIIPALEEGLLAQAKLSKRDGESDAKAFDRLYMNDIEYRKSWVTITEAKHAIALSKSLPNIMSTTPTSTEVGNTNVSDDSAKAVRLLQEMAERQHKTFEEVFLDSSNAELAARTYTLAHRPNKSSPSYSELER
jgi:hypothetical protein